MNFGLVAHDTRFLSVHPRTLAWWREREQCLRCRNYRKMSSRLQYCAATPVARNRYPAACIDAREPGCPCGPQALLFEARAAA